MSAGMTQAMVEAMSSEQRRAVLEMTQIALTVDFENLDDILPELGNTIANVYLRRFLFRLPPPPSELTSMPSWWYYYSLNNKVQLDYEFARKAVQKLRELASKVHPSYVNLAAEMWVSLMKYHIYDAADKSYVRHKIERLIHLHQVDEIPDLLKALRLTQP